MTECIFISEDQLLIKLSIYSEHSFLVSRGPRGLKCQSIPAILPHLQYLSKWLTLVHTHTHTYTHTNTPPCCQSKLGACSLNPIYGPPIAFLDVVSDMRKKGQNSSRKRREKCICMYLKLRVKQMDGRTEQRRWKGWNSYAHIRKR